MDLFDILAEIHPPWHAHGLCRGRVAEWYPVRKAGGPAITPLVRKAKAECLRCPVYEQCHAWALTLPKGTPGVAGGMSDLDRRNLQRARKPMRGPTPPPSG